MLSAIVTPRYLCLFLLQGFGHVWISMGWLFPGYSDDRAFVKMELHQPVSIPPLQSLKVFFEFFILSAVRVRYTMVASTKQYDWGAFGILCHVIYVEQEEIGHRTEPCGYPRGDFHLHGCLSVYYHTLGSTAEKGPGTSACLWVYSKYV